MPRLNFRLRRGFIVQMKNGVIKQLERWERNGASSKHPPVIKQRGARTLEDGHVGDRNLLCVEMTDLEASVLDICASRNSGGNREAYALGWLRAGLENDIDSAAGDLRKGGVR